MNTADVTLLVLGLTLAAVLGARRLSTPPPVVLAAAGLAVGAMWHLIPGLPAVRIPPERVLFLFLPPLLTNAAYALPLGAFRRNLLPIGLLAVGLVLATMAGVGLVAHATAGLPWAVALVLGAIVAPPDPVAATSVAGRTGLAHRLVVVLEGEGMVNDAVAIVAYELALAAALSGEFSWGHAALTLVREAPAGIAIGYVVGRLVAALHGQLDEVTLEAGLSLLSPYVAYEIADRLGGSGVLAVVTLGFVLQRRITLVTTPASRLAMRTVWSAVDFTTTALVFFLLGFLLGEVAAAGWAMAPWSAVLAVAAVVVALRLAWMYIVPSLTHRLFPYRQTPAPTWRERTVLGWAGMRGVVSLALALALPQLPGRGAAGDLRQTVVLLTLGVIVSTLLVQGATLLPLITRLGVGDPERNARDEHRLRARSRRAGLAALARATAHARAAGDGQRSTAADERLAALLANGAIGIAHAGVAGGDGAAERLAVALDAQRHVVARARDSARIGGGLAERLAVEVDVDALRVRGEAGRLTGAADE